MEGTEAYLTDLICQVHSTNITLDWKFWYHASRIKDGELGLGSNQTFNPILRGLRQYGHAQYVYCFAIFLCHHRNLDHHSRPSFSELCSSLKDHSDRGGPSLLDVPVEAVREPAKAAQLGAPLSWAQDLYTDLQQYYQ